MEDTQILLLILISILLISFNNKYPWVFGPIWKKIKKEIKSILKACREWESGN